jgi:hypothetical protein
MSAMFFGSLLGILRCGLLSLDGALFNSRHVRRKPNDWEVGLKRVDSVVFSVV